jgi:hypothetical protein
MISSAFVRGRALALSPVAVFSQPGHFAFGFRKRDAKLVEGVFRRHRLSAKVGHLLHQHFSWHASSLMLLHLSFSSITMAIKRGIIFIPTSSVIVFSQSSQLTFCALQSTFQLSLAGSTRSLRTQRLVFH